MFGVFEFSRELICSLLYIYRHRNNCVFLLVFVHCLFYTVFGIHQILSLLCYLVYMLVIVFFIILIILFLCSKVFPEASYLRC
jgi:hypothetical protein